MTIATTSIKAIYTCDGINKVYDFNFPAISANHIVVEVYDLNSIKTELTLNRDYSISSPNNEFTNGGRVTTNAAWPQNYKIVIYRSTDTQQNLDLEYNESMPSSAIEKALDKLTMVAQEVKNNIARNISYPISDSEQLNPSLPPAETRKNTYLGFGEHGQLVVLPTVPRSAEEAYQYKNEAEQAAGLAAQKANEAVQAANNAQDAAETAAGTVDDKIEELSSKAAKSVNGISPDGNGNVNLSGDSVIVKMITDRTVKLNDCLPYTDSNVHQATYDCFIVAACTCPSGGTLTISIGVSNPPTENFSQTVSSSYTHCSMAVKKDIYYKVSNNHDLAQLFYVIPLKGDV